MPELDLATLNVLLQGVRRHPNDRALRIRATDRVAALADHVIADHEGTDRLLADAIAGAKLLRRALEGEQRTDGDFGQHCGDQRMDRPLQGPLLKIIERPVLD